MPITLNENYLKISRVRRVWKTLGLIIVSAVIIFFCSYMLVNPVKMGTSTISIILSGLFLFLLIIILSRVIYFYLIDKTNDIKKIDGQFIVNDSKKYLLTDLYSVYITEYNNNARENSFNIYIKLKNSRKIPVAIRVDPEFAIEVQNGLMQFFNLNLVEKKKYWINI